MHTVTTQPRCLSGWCTEWQQRLSEMMSAILRQSLAQVFWHFEVAAAEMQETGYFLSSSWRSFPNCLRTRLPRNFTGAGCNFPAAQLTCRFKECGRLFVWNDGWLFESCISCVIIREAEKDVLLHAAAGVITKSTLHWKKRGKECVRVRVCVPACQNVCVCVFVSEGPVVFDCKAHVWR